MGTKQVPTVLLFFLAWVPGLIMAQTKTFSSEKSYNRVDGIAGTLDCIGSDSLNTLMTLWAEAFRSLYPNVTIQVEGKGSSTAPTALIEGTAQVGPMSRPMKAAEINQFRARYGYAPHAVEVALDTLAIYVHKDNPLTSISMDALNGIFSMTQRSGTPSILHWSELAVPFPWNVRRINLYGRNSASGTYGYFKNAVLLGDDFRLTVNEQPGSASVVQSVANDPFSMGYSGIGYRNSGVKELAVSTSGTRAVLPTLENCLNGSYPIARLLYIYVNKNPQTGIDPLSLEFLKFILSKEGQAIVAAEGYFPLPNSATSRNLNALNP